MLKGVRTAVAAVAAAGLALVVGAGAALAEDAPEPLWATSPCVDGYQAQYAPVQTWGKNLAVDVHVNSCDGARTLGDGRMVLTTPNATFTTYGYQGWARFETYQQIVLPDFSTGYDVNLTYTETAGVHDPAVSVTLPLTLTSGPRPAAVVTGVAQLDVDHAGKVTLIPAVALPGISYGTHVDPDPMPTGTLEVWAKGALVTTMSIGKSPVYSGVCGDLACRQGVKLTLDGAAGDIFTVKYLGDGTYAPTTGLLTVVDQRAERAVTLDKGGLSWQDFFVRVNLKLPRTADVFTTPYTLWVDGKAKTVFTLANDENPMVPLDTWRYFKFVPGAPEPGLTPWVSGMYAPEPPLLAGLSAGAHTIRITSPGTHVLQPVDVTLPVSLNKAIVRINAPVTPVAPRARLGSTVTFRTVIADQDGLPISGVPVVAEKALAGGRWQVVGRATANKGRAAVPVEVTGSMKVRIRTEGTSQWLPANAYPQYLSTVTAYRVAVRLGMPTLSSQHPKKGSTYTVSTTVRETSGAKVEGVKVTFQRLNSHGRWVSVGSTTAHSGKAAAKVKVTAGGKWRAVSTAAGAYKAGKSPSVTVRLK